MRPWWRWPSSARFFPRCPCCPTMFASIEILTEEAIYQRSQPRFGAAESKQGPARLVARRRRHCPRRRRVCTHWDYSAGQGRCSRIIDEEGGRLLFFSADGYTKRGYVDRRVPRRAGVQSGMAITTADEFFAVLEKSKLLEAKQLVEARRIAEQRRRPHGRAKLLARQGLITHWQAGQLLAGRTILFVGKYKLIRLLGAEAWGTCSWANTSP